MRSIWFVFFSVFYIGHLSAQPLFSDTSYTLEQIVITASRMDQVLPASAARETHRSPGRGKHVLQAEPVSGIHTASARMR